MAAQPMVSVHLRKKKTKKVNRTVPLGRTNVTTVYGMEIAMALPQSGCSSTKIRRSGIELEFGMLVFEQRGKPEYPEKTIMLQNCTLRLPTFMLLDPKQVVVRIVVQGSICDSLVGNPMKTRSLNVLKKVINTTEIRNDTLL